jgi:hypothetical protein
MMMIGMVLVWVIFIALIVWGFGWLFPSATRIDSPPEPDKDALRILSARYAQGQITREQFQLMRSDLEADIDMDNMDDIPGSESQTEEMDSSQTTQLRGEPLDY